MVILLMDPKQQLVCPQAYEHHQFTGRTDSTGGTGGTGITGNNGSMISLIVLAGIEPTIIEANSFSTLRKVR